MDGETRGDLLAIHSTTFSRRGELLFRREKLRGVDRVAWDTAISALARGRDVAGGLQLRDRLSARGNVSPVPEW